MCQREHCKGTIIKAQDQYGARWYCSLCAHEVFSTLPASPQDGMGDHIEYKSPHVISLGYAQGTGRRRRWLPAPSRVRGLAYEFAVYTHRSEHNGRAWTIDAVYPISQVPVRFVGREDQLALTRAIRTALALQHEIEVATLPWELVAL